MRRIDPKFHIENDQIIKTSNGEVVPEDEPLMLIRARDHLSVALLLHYRVLSLDEGCTTNHLVGVEDCIREFLNFAHEHPERMKQPDRMILARWMRVRLKAKPEKVGRVECQDRGRTYVRVLWDGNNNPCEILGFKIELDPYYEEHNAILRNQCS